MQKHIFQQLCREASTILGAEDVDMLGEAGEITIDNVVITLLFEEALSKHKVLCYVDLGPVEKEKRLPVFEELLQMNLLSGAKTNGVFAVDPTSGNALFTVHFKNFDALSGRQIADALRYYARQTTAVRDKIFGAVSDPRAMHAVHFA